MRLLLLSNSTRPGEEYLAWPRPHLASFLGKARQRILFVPYAGVRMTAAAYTASVRSVFEQLGHTIVGAAEHPDPVRGLRECDAVAVGGGNTFHLLARLYESGLLDAIRDRVGAGAQYVGWSAGANVACPTIRTTNDMPIVEPQGFAALSLVPFQINPHFLDADASSRHMGETREDRLREYLEENTAPVVGLREGAWLRREGGRLTLGGRNGARVFRRGAEAAERAPGASMDDLLGP